MSPRPFLFAVAAAAMALGATTVTVNPAFAATSDEVLVQHEDLNLASAAGRAVLEARIDRAARTVCGTAFINELDIAAGIEACRSDAIAAARRQLRGDGYAELRAVRAAN